MTSCGRIRWSSSAASSSRIRSLCRRRSSCVSFANGEPDRLRRPRRRSDMEVQLEHPAEEIKRLQRCINDLVSVLALPAIWSGGEPSQIVRTLLDVLLGMLHLDLVYVRLKDPSGEAPIEMVRVARIADTPAPAARDRRGAQPLVGELTRGNGLRWYGTRWRRRHFDRALATGAAR